MQRDGKNLATIAQKCPWYMFTGEEIAELCNISVSVVSLVRREPDRPFFLNKSRPEWFLEWMRDHQSFQLDRNQQENLSKKIDTIPYKPVRSHRSSSKNIKGRSRP